MLKPAAPGRDGITETGAQRRNRLYIEELSRRKAQERRVQEANAHSTLSERERGFQVMFSGANDQPKPARKGLLGRDRGEKQACNAAVVGRGEGRGKKWLRTPGAVAIERRSDSTSPPCHPTFSRPSSAAQRSKSANVPRCVAGSSAVPSAREESEATYQGENGLGRRKWTVGEPQVLRTEEGEEIMLRPLPEGVTAIELLEKGIDPAEADAAEGENRLKGEGRTYSGASPGLDEDSDLLGLLPSPALLRAPSNHVSAEVAAERLLERSFSREAQITGAPAAAAAEDAGSGETASESSNPGAGGDFNSFVQLGATCTRNSWDSDDLRQSIASAAAEVPDEITFSNGSGRSSDAEPGEAPSSANNAAANPSALDDEHGTQPSHGSHAPVIEEPRGEGDPSAESKTFQHL
uniref:Uncharacterized protein n=1 Tax=Chrysotila carterae TaxID=13221 RepID=A0A7S4C2K0_CHRCT